MLRGRRLELQKIVEAEARGESFWTTQFDEGTRTVLWHGWKDTCAIYLQYAQMPTDLNASVGRLLERQLRIRNFAGGLAWASALEAYWFDPSTDCTSVIEAMWLEIASATNHDVADSFAEMVNRNLLESRIAYELINGQIVDKESQELHAEVVAPVLSLLSGRPDFAKVEVAYQEALKQLHAGSPENAITDVGTALQEVLVALGCQGNQIGKLLADGKRRGLIAAHDGPLLDGILGFGHWVAADRSNMGDAHNAEKPLIDDAWLAIHVTGALILRLASGEPRQ